MEFVVVVVMKMMIADGSSESASSLGTLPWFWKE
jgi:hypothetical protein